MGGGLPFFAGWPGRLLGLRRRLRVAVAWGRLSTLDRRAKNGVNLARPPDALYIPVYTEVQVPLHLRTMERDSAPPLTFPLLG